MGKKRADCRIYRDLNGKWNVCSYTYTGDGPYNGHRFDLHPLSTSEARAKAVARRAGFATYFVGYTSRVAAL